MKRSLFLQEVKAIVRNKKVLIPIIAVLMVPLMYAGMFLWAFWDPYDHLEDLPVAVVNEDTGAIYEGNKLQLGGELVKKLKENDEFNFHFVSKQEAYEDLENQNYYLLVEIPEDFSKNATTLMDDTPKKLRLKYVPNESFNFLSSQIGETAVKEIKSAIASEVTATYAETMFDAIDEVADGLMKASDGTGELDNGAGKLKDGSKKLKDNLAELASKSIDFQNGVTKVHDGTAELADGSRELTDGVHQLADGSNQLLDASKTVQSGAEQLSTGARELDEGLQQVKENVPELVVGTDKLKDGLKEFQTTLPGQMAAAISQKMQSSSKDMNAGLDQLQAGLSKELSTRIAKQMAAKQQEQTNILLESLKGKVPDEVLQEISQELKDAALSAEQLQQQLQSGINDGLNVGFSQYKETVNEQLTQSASGLEEQIKVAVNPTFDQLYSGLVTVNKGQQTLQHGIDQLKSGSSQLYKGTVQLSAGQQQYVEKMNLFAGKLTEAEIGAGKLASGAKELNNGMAILSDGSEKISDGSHKLAEGSKELVDGTNDLKDGTSELDEKLTEAAEKAGEVEATDRTYDMMGNPVDVDKEEINAVPNYGTGFAPYFISLGLFVGALLITIVYQLNKPAAKPANGVRWFLGKFGILAIVGIVQAILVDVILLAGLGIEVQSIPLFIFVSIVTSLCFMALIQFLVTAFGDPGRFVAIVILIMQLTTSAGTFPLELIPNILRPLNALFPMTYSVQAFKAVISSGDYSMMWHHVGILTIYIGVFMVLTMGYFIVKHRKETEKEMVSAGA